MGNCRRAPVTLEDVKADGPPLRISDLVFMTGLAELTVKTDIRTGFLIAQRRREKQNSPYYVDRKEARRWLVQMGFIAKNGK